MEKFKPMPATKSATTKTAPKPAIKPSPKGQRPRCLSCQKELDPQYTIASMPAKLLDGRRVAQREAWEKANKPTFTGHYGRFQDDKFCGVSCGYNYAIASTNGRRKRTA